MRLTLTRNEPLESGLRRLGVECIDLALAALDEPEGRDVAIHSVRKLCKRTRALLRLFRAGMEDSFLRESHCFREVGRLLAVARDGYVVLDLHARLSAEFGAALNRAECAAIRQDLIAAWQAAVRVSGSSRTGVFDADDLRARLRAARSRARRWTLQPATDTLVLDSLVASYRRGRKALRRAATTRSIADFHLARQRAKDYVYQLEMVEMRFPELTVGRLLMANELTELLGNAHDLEVYRQTIERVAIDRSPAAVGLLSALAEQRSRALEAQALVVGRDVYAEKPAQFTETLERSQQVERVAS